MKPKIDKISIFSMLFIISLLSVPGFYAYFFTDWRNNRFYQDAAQRKADTEFQEDSRIYNSRVVLKKDKGITVNKSRLVFKGLKDKKILLDIFLLELDPEYAYPRSIPKTDARKIRIGGSTFQLLKVNKRTLQLKIITGYKS